jgi:hypothetical protein
MSAQEQHQVYSSTIESEHFTHEQLSEKWMQFIEGLNDRPNLKATLSSVPEIHEGFNLEIEIENSVQEDLINSIKPDLTAWLRKELKNSGIQVSTKITEKIRSKIIYTDSEKFDSLARKNPSLLLLQQKFNLDFGN